MASQALDLTGRTLCGAPGLLYAQGANPGGKAKTAEYLPTKFHLQVYDEMFYVLPMFSFPRPANYCDGEIGSFCNFVIGAESEDPYVKYRTTSQERPSKDDIDRMANNAKKYKAEIILNDAKKYKAKNEAVAGQIASKNGLESYYYSYDLWNSIEVDLKGKLEEL
ncbi:hypothetical protein H4Q26_008301 [Puccinia striiformis f. sp. tritici PST-130]|nr:hypothetical protein H4Q26_008301 [Puccinia striiformis f. sp. tritici PST-130]